MRIILSLQPLRCFVMKAAMSLIWQQSWLMVLISAGAFHIFFPLSLASNQPSQMASLLILAGFSSSLHVSLRTTLS
ncbi:hypothetical protein QQP08_011353 [Theobroma cacao]|nr:hypothetical protein QQP08_011353 [Theobroma cacao]